MKTKATSYNGDIWYAESYYGNIQFYQVVESKGNALQLKPIAYSTKKAFSTPSTFEGELTPISHMYLQNDGPIVKRIIGGAIKSKTEKWTKYTGGSVDCRIERS